jgi:hypothetical protein
MSVLACGHTWHKITARRLRTTGPSPRRNLNILGNNFHAAVLLPTNQPIKKLVSRRLLVRLATFVPKTR